MTKAQRYQFVIDYFLEHAPNAETELLYDDPIQLLVAVILSAQCTDKRVNVTTTAIFKKYPDAVAMSKATFDDLFLLIKNDGEIIRGDRTHYCLTPAAPTKHYGYIYTTHSGTRSG